MAGETIKTEAVCLDIRPWSRTSHVVSWLTPAGKVATMVKGAVRPKSLFLGQYDLNYTCEILYYARAKGDLHALRECAPVFFREGLRTNFRALVLADYYRSVVARLAPYGPDCVRWYRLLVRTLDRLADGRGLRVGDLLAVELDVLRLSGLAPDFSGFDPSAPWSQFSVEDGAFGSGGRPLRLSREVAAYLSDPSRPVDDPQIPLDAARAIGVFYAFHLDCAPDARRTVLALISSMKQEGTENER